MIKTTAFNCINKEVSALNNLYDVVQTSEYTNIINHLSQYTDYTKRIIVTGIGKNSNIATKIAETMASLGIPAFYLNTAHCSHGDYGFIGPDDTVIHISRSGKTREMIETICYIEKEFPSVTQILIHNNPVLAEQEPLAMKPEYVLFAGELEEGDEHGLAPTSSTTALLCILDCISVTLSQMNNFGRYDFLRLHPAGSLGAMLAEERIDNAKS
jgi:arabinose-5-phosphate isomerase